MDGQSGETQYEPIIEQCRTRIQHYDTLENWLLSIQQSGFDAESISTVRNVARERRLSAITRQVREDLTVQQGNQANALMPVLEILAALNSEDEYVYDTVLLVCDTAEPKNLESALATVRYCQSRAEQALRTVPELVARQRRHEVSNVALKAAFKGGGIGAAIGAVVGFISCIAVTLGDPTLNEGTNTFFACAVIGCALGAVSRYVMERRRFPSS